MRQTIIEIIKLVFNCSEEFAIHKLDQLDDNHKECVLKFSPAFNYAHKNWEKFSEELKNQLVDVPAPKDGSMVLVETRAVYVHRFLEPANPVYA